jgi:hypothetical protein
MSQQPEARLGSRPIGAAAEEDVRSGRKRIGLEGSRKAVRASSGMDADG